jgi:AraC-like DNA-binding protein
MIAEADLQTIAAHPDAKIVATEAFTLVKLTPSGELRGLVTDIALYREQSGIPIRQIETASLVVPLLIGFAEPFDIAIGRAPTVDDAYCSFTSGLCQRPVDIRSAGACNCLQINFTPLGARRFFAMPMSELTERMIDLDVLGDGALLELRERLGHEERWHGRLSIAHRFLVERMRAQPQANVATSWAFERLVASGGRARVGKIAAQLGWSRKHLAARFHDDIGLPPKAVARIIRFTRAQTLAALPGQAPICGAGVTFVQAGGT